MRFMKYLYSGLLIIVIACSIGLPFAQPVYANTSTLYPSGSGVYSDSTINGTAPAATRWQSVDEVVADDNTTDVYVEGAGVSCTRTDSYQLDNFVSPYAIINSVTLYYRVKPRNTSYGNASSQAFLYIGGTKYKDDIRYGVEDTWATYSKVWNTNPAIGGDWTSSAIDSMEIGVELHSTYSAYYGNNSSAYCTQMYIVVDYDPLVLPSVTTNAVTTYSAITATGSGQITATGGATVTDYGFVWDTSDKGDRGDFTPADGIGGWTKGWSIGVGSYPVGTYTHAIAGLILGTTYFVRFAAKNSVGWEYASAISFTTIANPSITTIAASSIAGTTARINASVTADGGEACTIVFIYKSNAGAHYANYAAILGAGGTEVTVTIPTATYTIGQSPYYDFTGLTAGSINYDFAVKITNAASTQYGSVLYFSTTSGVNEPSSFKAIAGSTTINLIWVKGTGSTNTYIRYKTGAYPVNNTDGTLINSTESTYAITGLIMGTTYYFRAWGLSGATPSGTYAQVMCTTLAAVSGTGSMPTIAAPTNWFTTSDPTVFSKLPIYGTVNWVFDAYQVPRASGWFTIAIILALMGGIGVYTFSHKIIIALFAETGFMIILSFMGMIPLFFVFICAAVAIGALVVGQRV